MKSNIIMALIIGIVFAAGCVSQTGTNETIKIGSILPLTGEIANIGISTQNSIQMAVDEINAQGGINGKKIEVIFEDGKCNAKDSADAGNKLINVDNIQVIIGGLCSGETLAVAPVAEQSKVVMLSPCSSAPKVSDAGDYIFRDYPSDTFQGSFAAEYAYNKLGVRKVALINTIGDWGTGLKDKFKQKFLELGGQIVAEESFEQDATDMRGQLTKIKATNPELIYMPAYTQGTALILKQAKELGLTAKMLGGDGADDPAVISTAGDAAEGFQLTVASPGTTEFEKKFREKFNAGLLVCTSYGYDAAKIVGEVLKKVGNNGTAIKNELYNVKDYNGASGKITFDKNGDRTTAEYIIKDVKNGQFVVLNLAQQKGTIKIGATLPLTGNLAFIGESNRDSMLLAKERLASKKYNYEVIFEDDQLKPDTAAKTTTKLISVDKVNAIVSLTSGIGNVVGPIAEQNKVVHMGIASDPNVANGVYNFIHWTPPAEEARVWVAEAQKRGIKKFAILELNQQGVAAIIGAVKNEIEGKDMQIVADEKFNFGDRDFRTIILKAKQANPDIYLVEGFSPEIELLVKQIGELGITTPLTSIEAFEISDQPELFEGHWYVNAADPTGLFIDEYKAKYARTPQLGAANVYDSILLLAEAFENAGDGKTVPSSGAVVDALFNIKDFNGALGKMENA